MAARSSASNDCTALSRRERGGRGRAAATPAGDCEKDRLLGRGGYARTGEQVEKEASFRYAASIAATRIDCLPGNARKAVAVAAIAANAQAERKT